VSRVQLALNVPDIDDAVDFYTKLFATEPSKRKPGYANFAIVDPPLKLVLFEHADAPARLNHLGVEVDDGEAVRTHQQRLEDHDIAALDDSGTCCYALQDKVWVDAPDGAWEIYSVLADSEEMGASRIDVTSGQRVCCSSVAADDAPCC